MPLTAQEITTPFALLRKCDESDCGKPASYYLYDYTEEPKQGILGPVWELKGRKCEECADYCVEKFTHNNVEVV